MIRKICLVTLLLALGCFCAYAADISGQWKGSFVTPVGINKYTYEFHVDGSKLTGQAVSSDTGAAAIQNGKIEGENLSFTEPAVFQGSKITITYSGKIQDDKIKLVRKFADFPPDTFTIKRAN